jgi:hypothetical protein
MSGTEASGTETSGTDELFPGATEHAAVPLPAAPTARPGIGRAALILGILAVLGDLIGIVVAMIALATAVTHVSETLSNVDNSLGAFLGVVVLEFAVYGGGIVLGLIAVGLGVIAAVRRRGRATGIVGAALGGLVVISHVTFGLVIGSSGNLPGVTN